MQLHPAIVTGATPDNQYLYVRLSYLNMPLPQIVRPILCSPTAGLHYMPRPGEKVWVAYLEGALPVAICGLGFIQTTDILTLYPLLPGESALVGPTGIPIKLNADGTVALGGASPSQGVARAGDPVAVSGTDSHGDSFSATGTITSGSAIVKAA